MSVLHHLMTLPVRPIKEGCYIPEITRLLEAGVPATYTLEQVALHEKGEDEDTGDLPSNTTPLHILAKSFPPRAQLLEEEEEVVLQIINILFEHGAGWNFLDYEGKHVGDILIEKGYGKGHPFYERLVDAGVSAELVLRKVNGGDVEFISDVEDDTFVQDAETEQQESATTTPVIAAKSATTNEDATAADQATYLKTELEYTEGALVTKENRDGVMMDWETDIMKRAATIMTKNRQQNDECNVLNIGFGMGIMDTFIQEQHPSRHYICEAHPDVLAKMKQDGWYEKTGVVILEGRWQDTLNTLLDNGDVFFDGIYYDTFSEHYTDILDLYDVVVGLLKPQGIFSFFNGLGADRQICYDVYRRIVEVDVANYGMKCTYNEVKIATLPCWDDVKRSYFACDVYYEPEITFK